MQAFDSFFLHFYAFFLKFDTPSIENRHALKSQINALSASFHISPARDYTREDKKSDLERSLLHVP